MYDQQRYVDVLPRNPYQIALCLDTLRLNLGQTPCIDLSAVLDTSARIFLCYQVYQALPSLEESPCPHQAKHPQRRKNSA